MRTLATILLLTAVSSAHADSNATSRADELFEQGRLFMAAGKYDVACRAFDDSQAIAFSVSTELNQGNCREKNGQLATAWQLFSDAAQRTTDASDENDRKVHDVAAERAARLAPRLSSLSVVVPAASRLAGLAVLRDGAATPIDRAVFLDGGTYTLLAIAPDHEQWSTTLSLASERDVRRVEVPALAPTQHAPTAPRTEAKPIPAPRAEAAPIPAPRAEAAPSAPFTYAPAPRTATVMRSTAAPSSSRSLGPAMLVGVGALSLLGTGLAFELAARDTYASSQTELDDARRHDLWQTANHQRYVAEGLAAAGVAATGLALYLALRHPDSPEPRPILGTRSLGLDPTVGAAHAGVQLTGSF